ncbi:MAG: glucose-phosphatase [Frankiaceae bacterium]|nr:glucose-phosphatase [Frankiaceae bacterium]
MVFDLGGVLADFGGVGPMRDLAGIDSDEELWRRWLACESVRAFERGHCTPEDFATGLVAEWELTVQPADLLAAFRGWLVGPYAGAEDLVRQVGETVTVACLSNTNAVHWEAGASRWPMLAEFDRTFLSFQIGLVKPDREIFQHVVTELGLPARQVLFLDDNEVNVEAALDVGMQAQRTAGVAAARAAIIEAGVLPA